MKEKKETKQAVTIGVLLALIVILSAIIVGLSIALMKSKKQESISAKQQGEQLQQVSSTTPIQPKANTDKDSKANTKVDTKVDKNKDLVKQLAQKELYEYDLLLLEDGTQVKPTTVTITDITIFEGEKLTEALNRFTDSEKENIEQIGTISFSSTYPEEYNGKGSKAGSSSPLRYFILSKINGEYKIELVTGL